MNFEKIRAGISTVADIGVFVGFVMVAFQLQQNTVALDAQAKAVMTSAFSAAETTMIGDDGATAWALSVTNPSKMTDSQILEVWAYFAASLRPSPSAFEAYRQKVISHGDYVEQTKSFAGDYLTTPFARIWWKYSKYQFPPELVNDVELAMGGLANPNAVVLQFEAIRRDVSKLHPG